ncbi:MAG TPA: DUF4139 domain-containing protein [Azospirillaceae bacterium]|nr:DUF4139 domain-containing protein [Azospirillaceae bacterium]
MFRPQLAIFAALAALTLPTATQAADLILRRVMLSTGGVGYFEYEARVTGDTRLALDIRRDQVDDVLKSIVVYDDRGGVGEISLPSEEPLREAFRDLPFTQEDLTSTAALLGALKGAPVTAIGNREVSGRLIAVTEETIQLPDDGGVTLRHRVSLNTADGIRQLILEDSDTLRLADPKLQAQVDAALAAIAAHAERNARALTILTTGPDDAERTVRVGYVIEAPLWKTSYRLTLAEGAPAQLQGWAVLENLSGKDWREVDLTVVSGNPVTFRQALYQAYFVPRPEVPVEVLGRVLPGVDQGTVDMPAMAAREAAPPPAPAPQAMMKATPPSAGDAEAGAARAPSRPAAVTAAESTEATTQVVFRYPQPITLAKGNSLLLPIASRPAPAERVDLYQPRTHPRHPLAAVRLTNDGVSGLPPGILTLYEASPDTAGAVYVGDARLATLPVGERRLLSFAVDQKIKVDRDQRQSQTFTQAKITDGVLQIASVEQATTVYTIAGAPREPRTVVIEHPRQSGWDLAEPKADRVEATPDAYRLPVDVPAGQTATLTARLERPRLNEVELSSLTIERIAFYATARELPQAVRDALTRLGTLRAAVTERERAVARLEKAHGEVVADQERLRENLGSVPEGSDLHRRYLAKLAEQETRLETLDADLTQARQALEKANQEVAGYVRGLTL